MTRKSMGVHETSCCLERTAREYSQGRGQGRNPLGVPLLDVGEGVSDLLLVQVSRAHGGGEAHMFSEHRPETKEITSYCVLPPTLPDADKTGPT